MRVSRLPLVLSALTLGIALGATVTRDERAAGLVAEPRVEAAAAAGDDCEMGALMPDSGRLTLEYVRPSTHNADRNDYRLTGTLQWDSKDALSCFDAGFVDWAYEHEIVYSGWFDRKIWNVTSTFPEDAGFYVDTTVGDGDGVTTLSFGIFRPERLSHGVAYEFSYSLFLPNNPLDGRHSMVLGGEVIEKNCGDPGPWCVGVGDHGTAGSRRAKSDAFIGARRGFDAEWTTCYRWTSDGQVPANCSPAKPVRAPIPVVVAPPAPPIHVEPAPPAPPVVVAPPAPPKPVNPPAPQPAPPPQNPAPPQPQPQPRTYSETTGGETHTWTNYSNAGGQEGPTIPAYTTVQIACKVQGFKVANGNPWWYRIAESPWNNTYYASADAFYNNGATSGSLRGTPWVDSNVPDC